MKVEVLEETGYDQALRGLAYSFRDRAIDVDSWWENQREKAAARAAVLASEDGGHNKFLESIQVWIDIEACRAFWSEFDTYRVGTTKQSESTMHTLAKRAPTVNDFEEGTSLEAITVFCRVWEQAKGDINILKLALPEGFLQRRIVSTNYKVLRNIILQRRGHRFRWWGIFLERVLSSIQHPELLPPAVPPV